jgi:hypothetical protein
LRGKIIIKSVSKAVLYFLVLLLSLLLSLYLVFRSTPVQTTLLRLAADYFSHKLNVTLSIKGFDISVRRGLVIEEIGIKDYKNTDLFVAHELSLKTITIDLKKHVLRVGDIFIDEGTVQLLTHRGDSVLNLQHILNYFASTDTTKKADTVKSPRWDIAVSQVVLRDTRFHFQDENATPVETGMDYANLDIRGINLDLTDIRIDGDTILANIRKLSARDRCGFNVRSLAGEFKVSSAFLKAKNLKILTDHSDLALTFDFLYRNWSGYNEFLDSVFIQAKIEPSYLDLQDIGFFAPELLVMKDRMRISGDIKGCVSNFKAKNFRVAFGNNTFFYGNVSAFGLPDVTETFIDLNIKAMNTNKADIESFLLPSDPRQIVLPGLLANIGVAGINGNFTGFWNDFVANARFRTDLGTIRTDLTLKKVKDSHLIAYDGRVDVGSFDVGRLIGDRENFGKMTGRADINGKGFSLDEAQLKINLRIDTARFYHYDYRNLDLEGALDEKKFNGTLRIRDPNLALDFDGLIDLRDSVPSFDFAANILKARLFDLHILERDSIMNLSTRIKVDFTGNSLDNLDGEISLENTLYREGTRGVMLNHLSLISSQGADSIKSYHLRSDFIDANISGNFLFRELVPSMNVFIHNYLASFSLADSIDRTLSQHTQQMNYDVLFKNTSDLTELFLPWLRISKNSQLNGTFNEQEGKLTMKGQSDSLNVYGVEFSNWFLDARTVRDNLSFQTGSGELFFTRHSDKDTLALKVDDFLLSSVISRDTIHYSFDWNADEKPSEFSGFASFRNSPAIELRILKLLVNINDRVWTINQENRIIIDTSAIRITRFDFLSEAQFLKINGSISSENRDTLDVLFSEVDISNLDQIFQSDQLDVDGIMSGEVKLVNLYHDITLVSDLKIRHFTFNRELMGDATFMVKYDAMDNRFDVRSQVLYTGNIGTNIPFSLEGSYFLDEKNPRLDFNLNLKNLNLRMFQPFVSSFMSGLGGLVSGNVKISGNPSKPLIQGTLSLMRTEFKITYLNVPYTLADVVTVDSNSFSFNKISITDSLGNKALLNGKITHHNFSDLRLDLNVEMKDFCAFNNTRAQNDVFFGQARATGTVQVTGPTDNIRIHVKAQTGGNTHIVVPISTTESVGQNDYIIFVQKETDSTGVFTVKPKIENSGLTLDLGIVVTPDAEIEVSLPDQMGNLKASGNGNIQMDMDPSKPFTMSGTYSLTKGSFLFQIKNLLRLPMSIKEGSRIYWTGDPTDANISVSAVYKTRAPLKGLTTNPEEEGIRIPVECIIRLGGKLMNPDMSFGIALPNVEESIKSLVYSAIDTNNPTTVAEQTIYLMVMNQFKPVVGTSGSVDVGTTSVALVTNQINSWLSQLTQHVNVGVNYRPPTSTTQQEFDVNVSTQLFNDRLLIDGTFGMNSYNSASFNQTTTIVGDINIEYILTRNRRWRIHAYNRTNTLTILNNNSPYTQGIGVTYQRDFATFRDLFTPNKKKEKNNKL